MFWSYLAKPAKIGDSSKTGDSQVVLGAQETTITEK